MTSKYTKDYSRKIEKLSYEITNADAIVIGAGAGLSTSSGFSYDNERFMENFKDFYLKYGITDMYSGGFYNFDTPEETWAYWSRFVYLNRYYETVGESYKYLLELVKNKNYFVLTTNVDHCFQKAGFKKEALFYTQGDYGLFQCSKPCHKKTYDNEAIIMKMLEEQKDMKIPTALIPKCPICGRPMSMNLRSDNTFVQDDGWHSASDRYHDFLKENLQKKILFLELGVGGNTPGIIKYPFWKMTFESPKAHYVFVNKEVIIPKDIEEKSLGIEGDILDVLKDTYAV